jgi:tetratricopeptide (TPR) repeat protein
LGKYQEALDHLNLSIQLEKDNPEAYFNRGRVLLDLGMKIKACEDLKKALTLNLNSENADFARQLIEENCR